MKSLKEKIQELYSKGLSKNSIAKELNCNVATVYYHVGENGKQKVLDRSKRNHKTLREKLKQEIFGGKCKICGYDKCLTALDFHHLDPKTKDGGISYYISQGYANKAIEEAKKCILVCRNCHAEIHEGLINLVGVSGNDPASTA